eukprot:scaffold533_cov369-Prasinococcus_capsulatus_cf.AAC.28
MSMKRSIQCGDDPHLPGPPGSPVRRHASSHGWTTARSFRFGWDVWLSMDHWTKARPTGHGVRNGDGSVDPERSYS